MVLLSLSKKLGGVFGPFVMRTGLSARQVLLGLGMKDSPYIDMILLIRHAQKVISLEVYEESAVTVTKFKEQTKAVDKLVDDVYDSLFGKNAEEEELRKASISKLRLRVLEDNLRPALVDNEVWSDVLKWRLNFRVLKWSRTEILISKYGPDVKEALDAYPQLRASPQLSRHPTTRMIMNLIRGKPLDMAKGRKTVLPSSGTLVKAFRMSHWGKQKDTQSVRKAMVPIAEKLGGKVLESPDGKLLNFADIPPDASLYNLSMEEIVELAGGHVIHCGPFNTVCEEAGMFQMWTEEYVSSLGAYLLDRTSKFDGETVVLDVGAGDGLLAHFLNEFVDMETQRQSKRQKSRKSRQGGSRVRNAASSLRTPTIVATDDGSWGIFAKAEVEKLNMKDSIAKYAKKDDIKRQLIVLCSWMPMGEDWSAFFRENGVDEYILIGEADDGSCGHNWETWGNSDFCPIIQESAEAQSNGDDSSPSNSAVGNSTITPPYAVDNYERWDMSSLSQYQFSRFDCAVSRSSKTVSFRKLYQ